MIQHPGQRIRTALATIEGTVPTVAAAWDGARFYPSHEAEVRRAAGVLRRAVAVFADVAAQLALAGDSDAGCPTCFACLGAGVATCCHCYGTGVEMPPAVAAELAGRARAALLEEVAP